MSSEFTAAMLEATEMTKAGRLSEATALIQRLLTGGAPQEAWRPAPNAAGEATGPAATLRQLADPARALDVGEPDRAPPIPAGARFDAGTYADDAGERDYRLYVPASAAGAGPRPLVLMLHGCTQDSDDFARGTGMNAAAEAFGCLVAYPEQPSSANPTRCWNWYRPTDQRREAGEPGILAGLVTAIIAAEAVDPARVYVAGLSAGGAAAAVLGAEYPELFAAVAVHSGLPRGAASDLPSALTAMRQGARGVEADRPVRTIVFHGDGDRVVHPSNAAALAAQVTAPAGELTLRIERGEAGGRAYSRALHRDEDGRTVCEVWTIHGSGHAWTGGDAAGTQTDPLGPDASREFLRFFLES